MKNFRHPGKIISRADASARSAGVPMQIGIKAAIPAGDYAANEEGEYVMGGVFQLKDDGSNHAQGVAVDWDIAGAQVVATGLGDFALGYVTKTGAAGLVEVMLNGQSY